MTDSSSRTETSQRAPEADCDQHAASRETEIGFSERSDFGASPSMVDFKNCIHLRIEGDIQVNEQMTHPHPCAFVFGKLSSWLWRRW
jgi:hypothetical protein